MNLMSEHKGPDVKFLLGFFLGGILGALIIFFMGTKEGKKTGKILERKGKDFVDELQERLQDLEEQGNVLAKKGEALRDQITEEIIEKKEEITKEVAIKADSALAQIENIQEKGRQNTANIRKKLFKNIPKR